MNYNKTGVSYVLSVLILAMITFSVAGGLYYWSNSLQLEQQGTAEQSQERLFDTLGSCIAVTSIDYDTLSNKSDVIFRNCGNSKLDVGDDKIKDIGVLQAPGIDPCSFNLNSTTCIGCPVHLDPGSSRLVVINWSRELTCTDRVTKGVKHQIVFYIDRLSTTSGIFTAEDVVSTTQRAATATNPGSSSATCGVSIANNSALLSAQTFTNGVTKSFCFNFTITNTGSQQDSFAIINGTTSDSSSSCKGAFLIDQSLAGTTNTCNAAGSGVIQASPSGTEPVITIDAGGTKTILLNSTISAPAAAGFCNHGLVITSNNCNSQSTNVPLINLTIR